MRYDSVMKNAYVGYAFCVAALCLAHAGFAANGPKRPHPLVLGDEDQRILILVPRAGDATAVAGGIIQEATALDIPLLVCTATGNPSAPDRLAVISDTLGPADEQLVFLGFPANSLLSIWTAHWRDRPPYRDPATQQTAVPYDDAFTPGAAYSGEDFLDDLLALIQGFAPTHILLPHPADTHSDNRALFLFAQTALWELEAVQPRPGLWFYPMHFPQWPADSKANAAAAAIPPPALSNENWLAFQLAPYQAANKTKALKEYQTPPDPMPRTMDAFIRKSEIVSTSPMVRLLNGGAVVEIPMQKENTTATVVCDGVYLSIRMPALPADAPPTQILLYSWNPDIPFSDMPKWNIRADRTHILSAHDLTQPVDIDEIEIVNTTAGGMEIRVPLDLLGEPGHLFVAVQASRPEAAATNLYWHAIRLEPTETGAEQPTATVALPESADDTAAPSPTIVEPTPPPPPPVLEKPEPKRILPHTKLPRKKRPRTEAEEPVFW